MPLLVYSVPFLSAVSMTALLFAFPLAISESTGSTFLSGLVIFVSGVAYAVATITLAVTRPSNRRSLGLVYGGLGAVLASTILPMLFPEPWWLQYLYAALQAAGSATLLVCFQIILDVVASRFPLPVAYSNFVMSWGLGSAVGPLLSGLFRGSSRMAPFIVSASATLLAFMVLVLVMRTRPREAARDINFIPPKIPPTAVRFGWVLIFLGSTCMATTRGVLPDFGIKNGFTDLQSGLLLFGMFVALTVSAFFMRFFYRRFLEQSKYFVIVVIGYVVSNVSIALSANIIVIAASLIVMGFCIAAGYYFAGFYALSDPVNKSRNVGTNESIASVAGILGPLSGAALADASGYVSLFLAMAVVSFGVFWWGYWRSYSQGSMKESKTVI